MATRCCWPPDSCAGSLSFCSAMPTRSSRAIASSSASPLFILRTLIGPRVTFCRIVLCANRLNDWNTMPTSDRSWASALPSAGSGTPSISIAPESMDSSRLMVRHSVDLPGARRADDDHHLAGRHLQLDVLQHVQRRRSASRRRACDHRSARCGRDAGLYAHMPSRGVVPRRVGRKVDRECHTQRGSGTVRGVQSSNLYGSMAKYAHCDWFARINVTVG